MKGARLSVRVQPRASKNEITGWSEGVLRVRLTAPPVDGAANEALVAFMAGTLGVRRADIALVSGEKSRTKTLEITGLTEAQMLQRLPEPT